MKKWNSKMRQQQKEPTTSVLDSVFYQSALRVNELEESKLNKIKFVLNNKYQRQLAKRAFDSQRTYEWAIEMRKTSGHTYDQDPDIVIKTPDEPQKFEETIPSCYFMYGMIIGERPILLKNFLGKKKKTKQRPNLDLNTSRERPRPKTQADIRTTLPLLEVTVKSASENRRTPSRLSSAKPEDERHPNRVYGSRSSSVYSEENFNTFMIDNKLVTQVPIGFTRNSVRPHTCFSSYTSSMLRPENARLPQYYHLRYRGVLPSVSMFR